MRASPLAAAVLFPTVAICATVSSGPETLKVLSGLAVVDAAVMHDGTAALRLEAGPDAKDARVELQRLDLEPGKHYVLTGWVKTSGVEVKDLARSPIAVGATISMASMPFDVHAVSLAGTRAWTEVRLPFEATASKDAPLLSVAGGGAFTGQAWFANVRVEGPVSSTPAWPSKAALQTFGPAYRYPEAGWIYLHIEGAPYERGYQHGH